MNEIGERRYRISSGFIPIGGLSGGSSISFCSSSYWVLSISVRSKTAAELLPTPLSGDGARRSTNPTALGRSRWRGGRYA